MKSGGTWKLLRVFVSERDRLHGRPLYEAVVEVLHRAGLGGATVFRGIEGYGTHEVVHAARVLDVVPDLPVLIEVVDTEERIRAFLPTLDEMVTEGLVTLETVEVIRYRSGPTKTKGTPP